MKDTTVAQKVKTDRKLPSHHSPAGAEVELMKPLIVSTWHAVLLRCLIPEFHSANLAPELGFELVLLLLVRKDSRSVVAWVWLLMG